DRTCKKTEIGRRMRSATAPFSRGTASAGPHEFCIVSKWQGPFGRRVLIPERTIYGIFGAGHTWLPSSAGHAVRLQPAGAKLHRPDDHVGNPADRTRASDRRLDDARERQS